MPKSSFEKSLRAFWARRRSLVLKTGFVAALLAVIAAGALYILPDVVASFAPKLDLKRDLYAMNRPPAFTLTSLSHHPARSRRYAQTGDGLRPKSRWLPDPIRQYAPMPALRTESPSRSP